VTKSTHDSVDTKWLGHLAKISKNVLTSLSRLLYTLCGRTFLLYSWAGDVAAAQSSKISKSISFVLSSIVQFKKPKSHRIRKGGGGVGGRARGASRKGGGPWSRWPCPSCVPVFRSGSGDSERKISSPEKFNDRCPYSLSRTSEQKSTSEDVDFMKSTSCPPPDGHFSFPIRLDKHRARLPSRVACVRRTRPKQIC
jgi:hypothetical protein